MRIPEPVQEQAIDDFLEGQPRAGQWREMRETLSARLKDSVRTRDEILTEGRPAPPALERKIKELREQVAALAQEEAVTQFVEDSVRSSLTRTPEFSFDEGDDDGHYGPGG